MKKLLPWIVSGVLAVGLIGVVAYFLMGNMFGEKEPVSAAAAAAAEKEALSKMTASEIADVSSTIDDIKTNLGDPSYVVNMSFSFQLQDAKTKEAFELIKDLKVKPLIIKTLADTNPDALNGAKGKDALNDKLLKLINSSLPEDGGKVVDIEITNFIVSAI
ncbi:flagellar basal body-associated FliL family protein [Paenibacillus sp. PsM32]|uniref:Flagellar protein FliL n=2 Tax=Paenibacillus TaxID=44249 RepID=A0ABW4UWI8_9BACL|nr:MULTISPECIES: flagellar basal body-associated FliL family protein [Paenibacillus]MDN4616544.1 flagellar basal body-associated FliL family protein [Paenibacillus sp. PsM32]MDQ1233667.1 flagellar FliL protein [Paenibacillus sp. SORGH_AS_0306]MDR6110708.1 flagellar FliL protein [Paenibacillus sp. SORGH_AS_0338]WCT57590.1 flagellar basal body-associated FliL family protein [Paenibacillus kyungheensis]WDF49311.1 flagellar basal body-associated FliL family protein [Paenibacillus sp. KACC 21273]